MLTRNLHYIKSNRPELLNTLMKAEKLAKLEKVDIQSEDPERHHFVFKHEQQIIDIHDKSDPWGEADQLLQQVHNQLQQPGHQVLFFGVGLGHLVQRFITVFPKVPYSIYEPSAKALLAFMSEVSLENLNIHFLRNLFVGFEPKQTYQELQSFIHQTSTSITILSLPSYQKLFQPLHKHVLKAVEHIVRYKNQKMHINRHYEKKWVKNSMDNFIHTIYSRSIFDFRAHFQDKPVVLAAAGPSLEDEIEHIRTIKDRGSAYIFTVGSAINTFIEHQLVPDAAFTYDPSSTQYTVFSRALQENKVPFPLVFGTTVGQNTLQQFPWTKIRIPISQDPVTAFYFGDQDSTIVQDAPSIAVITLQVLIELKCSQIILAGQNLAYRNNQFYAGGVPYAPSRLDEAIPVQSVSGATTMTNTALNLIRKEMEHYIRKNPDTSIINTTQDGAAIEGTVFKPLVEVMSEWPEGCIVPEWYLKPYGNELDVSYVLAKKENMYQEHKLLERIFAELLQTLQELTQHQRTPVFQRFDMLFKRLQQNLFFRYFIQPMNRVEYELLYGKMATIKVEVGLKTKAELVLSHFGKFLYQCYEDFKTITSDFEQLNQIIDQFCYRKDGRAT